MRRIGRRVATAVSVGVLSVTGLALSAPADAATTYYTARQVAQHKTAGNCWTIVGKGVYNLTSWVSRHPGGSQAIKSLCGRNGTKAFQQQHGSTSNAISMLSSLRIGTLRK